jgi:uncharacterized membrane protein HdeD (DUF308 family)
VWTFLLRHGLFAGPPIDDVGDCVRLLDCLLSTVAIGGMCALMVIRWRQARHSTAVLLSVTAALLIASIWTEAGMLGHAITGRLWFNTYGAIGAVVGLIMMLRETRAGLWIDPARHDR